jgi:putative endonuclease
LQQNKRKTGEVYEQRAVSYLKKCGYRILKQNFRCHFGEIDIIAKEGDTLVFLEVKYRSGHGSGTPQEAVNYNKQRRISKVAAFYLTAYSKTLDQSIRFDVVAISGTEITLIKNAFEYRE